MALRLKSIPKNLNPVWAQLLAPKPKVKKQKADPVEKHDSFLKWIQTMECKLGK